MIYADPSGHLIDRVFSAVAGAIVGGITAAIQGEDIGQGVLTGAISGALFYCAGEELFGANRIVSHAIAGSLSGGINGAITGGDIGMGMITGGISGGFGEYAGRFIPDDPLTQFAGRSVIGGITGGAAAMIGGGDFADGFSYGMRTAAIGYLGNHLAHDVIT